MDFFGLEYFLIFVFIQNFGLHRIAWFVCGSTLGGRLFATKTHETRTADGFAGFLLLVFPVCAVSKVFRKFLDGFLEMQQSCIKGAFG